MENRGHYEKIINSVFDMCIMREVFKVMGQILNFYTTDNRYRGKVNMDVIKFIDTVSSFPSREGNVSDNIDHLFCAGYLLLFCKHVAACFQRNSVLCTR